MRTGTYKGTAKATAIEFRVERDRLSGAVIFSGDAIRHDVAPVYVVGSSSQIGQSPDGTTALTASINIFQGGEWKNGYARLTFLGNPDRCDIDIRVSGLIFLRARCSLQHRSLRQAFVTIFGEERVSADRTTQQAYWPRHSDTEDVRKNYHSAGVEVDFFYGGPVRHPTGQVVGWRTAELNDLVRSLSASRGLSVQPNPNYILLSLGSHESNDLIGLMFDESDDFPRQGCAIFMDHPYLHPADESARKLRNVWAISHEVGHCLNLLHTFDPAARDAQKDYSLSWMNYPYRYDSLPGHRSGDFWVHFNRNFRTHEQLFLRHGSLLDVFAGGRSFGKAMSRFPSSAAALVESGSVNSTKIDLEPIPAHETGDPVYIEFTLPIELVQSGASVASGEVVIFIEDIRGEVRQYLKTATECRGPSKRNQSIVRLRHKQYIGAGRKNVYFSEVGKHYVWVSCCSSEGERYISNVESVDILPTMKSNEEIEFLVSRSVLRTFEFGEACGSQPIDDFRQRVEHLSSVPARIHLSVIIGKTLQRTRRRLDVKNNLIEITPPDPIRSMAILDRSLGDVASDPHKYFDEVTGILAAQARNLRTYGDRDRARKIIQQARDFQVVDPGLRIGKIHESRVVTAEVLNSDI